MSAVTDVNGVYSLSLAPGHYQIQFEHPDYETATTEADVVSGQTTTVNINLKKKKGVLAGKVTDEETTQPIASVTVTTTKV